MILFDYGQTLIDEAVFDGVAGTAAVLAHARENRYGLTAQQVQDEAERIMAEIGRFDIMHGDKVGTEIHNRMFNAYLYESLGIRLDIDPDTLDRIFWDAAAPGKPTEGITDFLGFLEAKGIRTAVLSNIGYSGVAVAERIDRLLPGNRFEFILATSEYLFRKPSPRIFRLALEKARLNPEDVWYTGDNYVCDIEGAASAGIKPVWYKGALRSPAKDCGGYLSIGSWNELKDLIEKGEEI